MRERYADFGPTLAGEKLAELHDHHLCAETLRRWLIADGLWRPKRRRQARIHPRRPRRRGLGELVQIDGSPHDWFEGRAEPGTLIVFIDDATSRLLALRFVSAETPRAYMETLASYLTRHGRPVALYSDRHSIFRVNHPECDGALTQFSRALKTLDIAAIHANSPTGEGPRGTGQPDPSGPAGQGTPAPRHKRYGYRQRLYAGLHGRLQPAFLRGAAQP